MKILSVVKKYLQYLIFISVAFALVFLLYFRSIPEKYNLNIGDSSPYDVNSPRRIVDKQATSHRAKIAYGEVEDIYTFDAKSSHKSLSNVDEFINKTELYRKMYTDALEESLKSEEVNIDEETVSENNTSSNSGSPGSEDGTPEHSADNTDNANNADNVEYVNPAVFADDLKSSIKGLLVPEKDISREILKELIEMDEAAFSSLCSHLKSISEIVLSQSVSDESLSVRILTNVDRVTTWNVYHINKNIPVQILSGILESNLSYDKQATEKARQLAHDTVIENPVYIEKGTRIINYGDIITSEKYELLKDLDLLATGKIDLVYLAGIILLVALIFFFISLYIKRTERGNIDYLKDRISIASAFLIPFIASVFLVKLSVFAPPVYITALLITAYYGFKAGFFMSTLLAFAVFPMTGMDHRFLFVVLAGSFATSIFTMGMSKRYNYALIIISTTITTFMATVTIDLLTKTSAREMMFDSVFAAVSSSFSVMIGLGIMPLFEMIFNSVSPLRLIELTQPGNPLLSRLFVEAPGTSQHCVMVGNLAEAAAEAIGANPLVARVGAYYHDIGKLKDPIMYTENQSGINPHDSFSPAKSFDIINSHHIDGIRMAKKHRLPSIVIKMIDEHHGTTTHAFFYHKALEESKNENTPPPDRKDYTYKGSKPSFRESGILMLADSVEAAMKSTGITDVEKAEELIRKIVKNKIDEDQLTESGLSFKDVENIIQAFVHVYSGHFRIRVRYPDDSQDKK